eukprot:gb/GECH01008941.1/.p1 GENE.gb/GECH01008941.1/~~gb/GECH01008941.1/.p1  ORF type:complete len:715 (+),score=194.04 gb/GECH01008941.1/:1-2145(+)
MSERVAAITCHFCERDGPSVLFCSQPLTLPKTLKQFNRNSVSDNNQELYEKITEYIIEENNCILEEASYVTIDNEEELLYISGDTVKTDWMPKLKTLCLNCLSGEIVGPGREGPIVFGNIVDGYALAYVFKITDSRARGAHRWMSFMLWHRDLAMIVNCWASIRDHLAKAADSLKYNCKQVFDKERQLLRSGNYTGGHAPPSVAMFRQRRSNEPLRPLPILLNYPQLFVDLHSYMSHVLSSYLSRLSLNFPHISFSVSEAITKASAEEERIHQSHLGNYNLDTSDTDTVNDCESPKISHQNSQIYFHSLSNLFQTIRLYFQINQNLEYDDQENDLNSTEATPSKPQSQHRQHVSSSSGDGSAISENISATTTSGDDSHPQKNQSSSKTQSKDQKQQNQNEQEETAQQTVDAILQCLFYNIVSGYQIVAVSEDENLANDIIKLLSRLLPERCVSAMYSCKEYQPPYLCNLLSLIYPEEMDKIDTQTCMVIRIEAKTKAIQHTSPLSYPSSSSSASLSFNRIELDLFDVEFEGAYSDSILLGKQFMNLFRINLDNEDELLFLQAIHDEWDAKTRGFFHFMNAFRKHQLERMRKEPLHHYRHQRRSDPRRRSRSSTSAMSDHSASSSDTAHTSNFDNNDDDDGIHSIEEYLRSIDLEPSVLNLEATILKFWGTGLNAVMKPLYNDNYSHHPYFHRQHRFNNLNNQANGFLKNEDKIT